MKIPDTVTGTAARNLYEQAAAIRAELKATGERLERMIDVAGAGVQAGMSKQVVANLTLAYRAAEDVSFRLGKTLQHLDGGVSVYDRATTMGPTPTGGTDGEEASAG